jgi:hypothetical protein
MDTEYLRTMQSAMHHQHHAIHQAFQQLPDDASTAQPLLYAALSNACSAQSTACDALHVLSTVLREVPTREDAL